MLVSQQKRRVFRAFQANTVVFVRFAVLFTVTFFGRLAGRLCRFFALLLRAGTSSNYPQDATSDLNEILKKF